MTETNRQQITGRVDDSLRTRIAAALKAEDERLHICPFDGEPTMSSYDNLADAVIREVLTPEFLADLVIQCCWWRRPMSSCRPAVSEAVQKAADDE